MLGLRITQATMDVFDTVTDLHVALNQEMAAYSVACPKGALERPAIAYLVNRQLRRDDFSVWLAVFGDQVVGFISGAVLESPVPSLDYTVGTISNLYVLPRYRRHGVGAALVAHLMEVFAQHDARHVELSYLVRNESGAEFWTSQGFAPESVRAVRMLADPDGPITSSTDPGSESREVREVR